MNYDRDKSKEQLIAELEALRQENAELKNTESKPRENLPTDKKKQAINQDLREQEALYRSLVEDHPYSVDLFLPGTTIIFVNNHLASTMGYTPEKLKGKKWIDFLPENERNHVLEEITMSTPENPVRTYESSYFDKDGTRHWNLWSHRAFFDEQGQLSYFQAVGIDITERKKAEEEIKNERAYLSAVLDNIEEAIVICDAEGRIARFNETARRLHGLPEEPIPPDQWAEHYALYQEDGITPLPMEEIPLFRALQGERVLNAEIVVAPKHSGPYYLGCSGQALTDDTGKIMGAVSAMYDLTERKRMEQSLRHERDLSQRYLDTTQTAIVALDTEGRITMINRAGRELLGYAENEILGCNWFETCLPQPEGIDIVYPEFQCIMNGDLESVEYFENNVVCKDGTQRLIGWHNAFLEDEEGRIVGTLSSGEDITERNSLEQELKDQNNLLESIINGIPDVLAIQYPDHRIARYNLAGYQFLNMSLHEVRNKKCFQLIGRDRECEQCATREALRTKRLAQLEKYVPELGMYLDCRSIPILDEQGEVAKIVEQLRDITSQKRIEEALRQSENYYRAIFETSGAIMFIIEDDTTISNVNSKFEDVTGYSRHEVEGRKSWTDFVNPDDLDWLKEYHYWLNYDPNVAPRKNEVSIINRHGERRDLFLEADMIPGTNQRIASCIDITERKRTEKILQARLRLMEISQTHSFQEILTATIDEAENLTDSQIGFYHFLQPDQRTITLQAWSARTKTEVCSASSEKLHYDIHEAGVWMDCIRKEEAVIHNDYSSLSHRKGVPPGHPTIIRELLIPVYKGNSIVALLGVGNKPRSYTDADIEAVSLLADLALDITERKQAEETMQQSENYYRAIFETSGTAMAIIEGDTTISKVNSKFEELTGYSGQEVEGRQSFIKFVHPDDLESLKEYNYLRYQRPTSAPRQYEFRFMSNHGEWRNVNLTVDMIPGTNKTICSGLDITERKQAEKLLQESEERYRLLVENAFEGIGVVQDGEFKWVNPRIYEMLGCSKQELATKSVFDFVHPEERDTVIKKHYERMQGHNSARIYTFRILTNQGEVLWCQLSVIGITWENRPADLCFFSDISEQKRIESELEVAKQRAEEANRAKSEFLANMSHEIRTPINGIMGMLQLLQASNVDEQQEKYVGVGLDSTRRLNRLLTDILDLSKIEANKLVIKEEEFVFVEAIKTIEDIFNQLTKENQNDLSINLDENIPEKLVGDNIRLNQILFNLVGNANKYTQNGRIELEVSLLPGLQSDNCRVLFVVADNGQGIPEDKLDRVFDVFTQGSDASSYTREFEGAGLGLPLVKRLVDLMQGSIAISSKEGEGTSVYVSLPFKILESMQYDANEQQFDTQENKAMDLRILLVEDDETAQLHIRTLLEKQGSRVTIAANGKKALSLLENEEFDCILMDIQMPLLDGVETTEQIRASNTKLQNIPIIAMTAYAMSGDREKFLESGMDDYIAKPVDKDELLEVLERNVSGPKS